MKWNLNDRNQGFLDTYTRQLTQSFLMKAQEHRINKIADKWKELTGNEEDFSAYNGCFYIYLDMGKPMANGEYPDKGKHLGQLLEYAEEVLGYTVDHKRERNDSVDNYSHTFQWYGWKDFPNIQIHAQHGGNCKLVKTNVRYEERWDYDTVCE